MSEQEYTDSDSTTEEIEDETSNTKKKALPWHSTDLVKRVSSPDGDDQSTSSSGSSTISDKKKKKTCYKSNALPSEQSLPADIEKRLKITSDDKDSQKRNVSPELKILKQVLPEDDFPWDRKAGDTEMKDPPVEINILLLGESGVGKSTFINSFANYMKHENFEAVQENVLSVLIPARFHIFDNEFKKHLIEIETNEKTDQNEYLADGAAATQDVKTYVFYITLENKSYLIRLIDTPGIGDPRGIAQDNKNCDYVLSYLGRLEKIHAICLLLKPTNTRLDVFLNYCVTQILSRLEKSATDNIAFLFTNTRGQNYTPGDTYTSLEVLVKKIKDANNVTLPLSHKNVFCFDNEAFRFLASIKQGVEFKEGILEANIESWKYSYKEVYRLISYIVLLKPHDPQKTVSINHARKMVLQLSKPLAEIVQLIGDNIYQLDQHTHQLLTENQTLDELKQKLYMPVIDIIAKELDQPVTVCTAPKCSSIYKVAEKNKFHYKQRCHNPCYLNNVPAEIVGDPLLLGCAAMNRSTQSCKECGCRFNTHMHIYYETDTFERKIVDQNIQKNITCKEDAAKEKQIMINKILNHKEALEKEHAYIIKCSAAFAYFLQRNAITPINDSLKEYVNYLISREETLGPESDRTTLEYLRRLLSEYEQEKNVLEEALKHNTIGMVNTSPNVIESKIKELFTLPNFGKKIKQLYDLHQSAGLREHKQSEYVVKERYTLSIVDKVKSYGSAVIGALGFGKSKKQHRIEYEQQRVLAMEQFERDYYGNQLMQRHGGDPRLQSNFTSNGQYFGANFGPHGSRNPYEFQPYNYGYEAEHNLQPSGREQRRGRYELDYGKRENDRQARFNSRYNETEFTENHKDKAKNVYADSEKGKKGDNRQVTLNERKKKAPVKETELSNKDENIKPSAQKGGSNKLALSSGSDWKSASDVEDETQVANINKSKNTAQTLGKNGKKNNKNTRIRKTRKIRVNNLFYNRYF